MVSLEGKEQEEESLEVHHKNFPAWAWNVKTLSIVQTTILCQFNSGANRSHFSYNSHMVKQLHKSRVKCQPGNNIVQEKAQVATINCDPKHPLLVTERRRASDKNNPHLELRAIFLEIIDSKFIHRSDSRGIFTCSEIQPSVSNLNKSIRTAFSINTGTPKCALGKYDIFYPNSNVPTSTATLNLKLLHPVLFLIPPDGTSLQLYNLNTGTLENSYTFNGSVKYERVTFQAETSSILVTCRKSTLPGDIFDDVLQFSYPPLCLVVHVQVQKDAAKRRRVMTLEFSEEYLLLCCAGGQVIVCDLEKLLSKSRVDWVNADLEVVPSHLITEFTDVLIQVASRDAFLSFDPTESPYYIGKNKKSTETYELLRMTKNGPIHIKNEYLPENTPPEQPFGFLRNFGPRLILRYKGVIRIWAILNIEPEDPTASPTSQLQLLWEKDYNTDGSVQVDAEGTKNKREGLRVKAPVSYCEDVITLNASENEFLMQLAVVRFARQSLKCFIYDSYSYDLVYKIEPHFFSPGDNEICDIILVDFIDNIVTVQKKSNKGGQKTIYTFNLLRGLL